MRNTRQFNVEYECERFTLEVHTENPAHEARIRWEMDDSEVVGEWGRLYLPDEMGGTDLVIQEPTLVFGGNETAMIHGEERERIKLPRPLASQLQDILNELGTATLDSRHICNNPAAFPDSIDYWTKIEAERLTKTCWDSERYMMWYAPDKPNAQNVPSRLAELVSQLDVYGYQFKCGKLIHRTEEHPSTEAVDELKRTLQQALPDSDEHHETDSYRIEEPLN